MDDLKIYTESDQKPNKLIEAVTKSSKDIGMFFGLDKCSKCTIRKGKKVRSENILIGEDSFMKDLDENIT